MFAFARRAATGGPETGRRSRLAHFRPPAWRGRGSKQGVFVVVGRPAQFPELAVQGVRPGLVGEGPVDIRRQAKAALAGVLTLTRRGRLLADAVVRRLLEE